MNLLKSTINCCLALCVLSLAGCYYDNEEELYGGLPEAPCDTTDVSYTADIVPILEDDCIVCHSGSVPSAGISLETYADVKVQADNGRLVGSIAHLPGFDPMPQGGAQLPDCEVNQVTAWVNAGALDN
ncbi:hypothetical protein [Pontibacter sp. G13]|uniref:hypothetical protein n=1 Tax=Pontibacter sp. G13 TaxID=3074898 RepID=UPI00288C4185|nr:hypothetical protein [Pontibacter sp. G13]WNJ18117.1 hypothetical protein RJD25_24970 [Pontibacter sp. G13]